MPSPLIPLVLSSVVSSAAPLAPDARGRAAPDRNFDIERLVLDLDVDHADASVEGTATIHANRLWEGPLVLHQIDLEISAVEQDGVALRWWTEGVRLLVEVPGDTAVVTVTYSATPDNGLHFRYARRGSPDAYDEIWTQGEGEDHRHWFPSWDQPTDRFVYEGTIRGPEGWESVTNSGHDMVNYLVMFAAAPYDRHTHPDDAGSSHPPSSPTQEPGLGNVPSGSVFARSRVRGLGLGDGGEAGGEAVEEGQAQGQE